MTPEYVRSEDLCDPGYLSPVGSGSPHPEAALVRTDPKLVWAGPTAVGRTKVRIGILRPEQDFDDEPNRFVKKSAAETFLRRCLCDKVYDDQGKLLRGKIRERQIGSAPSSDAARFLMFNGFEITQHRVMVETSREPEGLLLQYPLPDQSSFRRVHRKRTWGFKGYVGPQVWDELILSDVPRTELCNRQQLGNEQRTKN